MCCLFIMLNNKLYEVLMTRHIVETVGTSKCVKSSDLNDYHINNVIIRDRICLS